MMFWPRFCTKPKLGRGQHELLRWILLWSMSLIQNTESLAGPVDQQSSALSLNHGHRPPTPSQILQEKKSSHQNHSPQIRSTWRTAWIFPDRTYDSSLPFSPVGGRPDHWTLLVPDPSSWRIRSVVLPYFRSVFLAYSECIFGVYFRRIQSILNYSS